MPDITHAFGGGATSSLLSPIILILLLAAVLLMFVLPRRFVIIPFLVAFLLTPGGQQLYFGGSHWFVGRILVLAALVRLAVLASKLKGGFFANGLTSADKTFLLCMLCQAVCVSIRYAQAQAVINQAGFLIDSVGAYIIVRCLIRSRDDVYIVLKCFAILCAIFSVCMLWEQVAQHNLFGELGGVQLAPDVREGKIRSQAAFAHALTAGTFAATLLPLFVLLWRCGKSKTLAAVGLVASALMTYTSQSSTPLLAYGAAVAAICIWPIRRKMREVRIGIVLAILGLAMVMKAPVWYIIAHIDLTGGSSGWHRAALIDLFIRHFSEWWLLGSSNSDAWAFDMWDTQNQFVNVGVSGGLLALGLFIAMITLCFSKIGKIRKAASGRGTEEWFAWLLGAALFANVVGFFGVNYFDQSKISWFALLAMISAAKVTQRVKVEKKRPAPAAAVEEPKLDDVPVAVPTVS
jgi:hypothetical protein